MKYLNSLWFELAWDWAKFKSSRTRVKKFVYLVHVILDLVMVSIPGAILILTLLAIKG